MNIYLFVLEKVTLLQLTTDTLTSSVMMLENTLTSRFN